MGDSNIAPGVLFNGEVAFPILEDLDISNLGNVEKIWHNEFIADSFRKLKRLSVGSSQKLQNVIPYNMLKRLPSLQILKIVDCNSVEEVFDLEAIDSKENHDIPALQLRELCLDNLKNLKCVWNRAPQGLLTYQNLKRVQVSHCPSLEIPFPGYVVRSLLQVKEEDIAKAVTMFLFPEVTSLTKSCPKELACFYLGLDTLEWPTLRTLEVESCESLEMLASKLDKPVENPIFLCDKAAFPNLESLNLSLKVKEIQHLHLLFGALFNLKTLMVESCPFLMNLFSSDFIKGLKNLENLTVKKCDQLQGVFDLNGLDHGEGDVEMLSKLERLNLIDLPELKSICNNCPPQVLCFRNLKLLQVKQCDSLMYLFSSSMALGLVQLQDICIENCSMVEQIVAAEERVTDKISFPQITSVSLLKLPKLACFYLRIQTLEKILMGDSNIDPGVLFNDEVAFPNLEFLYVSGLNNIKKIWHNQLLADSFSKLKKMKVKICNELQNISTSNVLNWLPSLEFLKIDSCGKLREVFDQEVINVQKDVTDTQLSPSVLDDLQQRLHISNKVPGKYLCLQKLKVLKVHNCGSLKNIFSPYTALGLVPLEGMKENIAQEEAEEVIEFPELTSLSLQSLPSLASFYPGSHTLGRVGPGDHDILVTVLFFTDKVAFPSLVSLHISSLDNIKEIWNNKRTANSFSRLEQVKVEDCNGLQNGLPLFVLKWLSSLQFLRLANCGKLKEVFDLEGAGDFLEGVTSTKLNHLVLQELPQLQHIWNKDPYGILTFQNLDLVEVFGFHGLKSHFPAGSLVRDFSQLEKQLIRSRQPEDFGNNEGKDFVFPKVIIRSRWTEDLGEKDEGEDFVFPEVTYDKLLDVRKIKGKEVLKVHDYVSEISEDIPGSSG